MLAHPLPAAASPAGPRFVWLLDRRRDLAFYIGSVLAGWLYVGILLYALARLADPWRDPLWTLSFGGIELPLTLTVLVVMSWAYLLDAPHVWATLGRTLADPDEWRERRGVLLRSFAWFGVGPALILLPYGLGALSARWGRPVSPATLALGATLFFVAFRLWAYYHVVRQHWGFLCLYNRKAGDEASRKVDLWCFNLLMYLPLLLFLTSSYYGETPGFPPLGLHAPLFGSASLATFLHPLAWVLYGAAVLAYAGFHLRRHLRGEPLNGSKLLYLLPLLPLHFVAFSHPLLAAFVVPIVTVGHNIQYHAIVYTYGRKKYGDADPVRYRWPRLFFRNLALYGGVGLLFTFGFYRGPWIEWLRDTTGLALDQVMLNSLGMMAGVRDPAALGLGEKLLAAALLGFAMQHYFLDARIWRVSRDRGVQKNLGV